MKQTTTRITNNQIKQQIDKENDKGIDKDVTKEISAYKLAMANACMNCGYDDNR